MWAWVQPAFKHAGTGASTSEVGRRWRRTACLLKNWVGTCHAPSGRSTEGCSGLRRRLAAGLRPWLGPDVQWVLAEPEACSKLAAAILQRAEAEETSFQARRLQSWRSWVAGATKPGSSAGHRWAKGANGWASDAMADHGAC